MTIFFCKEKNNNNQFSLFLLVKISVFCVDFEEEKKREENKRV